MRVLIYIIYRHEQGGVFSPLFMSNLTLSYSAQCETNTELEVPVKAASASLTGIQGHAASVGCAVPHLSSSLVWRVGEERGSCLSPPLIRRSLLYLVRFHSSKPICSFPPPTPSAGSEGISQSPSIMEVCTILYLCLAKVHCSFEYHAISFPCNAI